MSETALVTQMLYASKHTAHPYARKRMLLTKRAIVDQMLREMLHDEIIRPSNAAYSSPILFVPKKDGDSRLCLLSQVECCHRTRRIPLADNTRHIRFSWRQFHLLHTRFKVLLLADACSGDRYTQNCFQVPAILNLPKCHSASNRLQISSRKK